MEWQCQSWMWTIQGFDGQVRYVALTSSSCKEILEAYRPISHCLILETREWLAAPKTTKTIYVSSCPSGQNKETQYSIELSWQFKPVCTKNCSDPSSRPSQWLETWPRWHLECSHLCWPLTGLQQWPCSPQKDLLPGDCKKKRAVHRENQTLCPPYWLLPCNAHLSISTISSISCYLSMGPLLCLVL